MVFQTHGRAGIKTLERERVTFKRLIKHQYSGIKRAAVHWASNLYIYINVNLRENIATCQKWYNLHLYFL